MAKVVYTESKNDDDYNIEDGLFMVPNDLNIPKGKKSLKEILKFRKTKSTKSKPKSKRKTKDCGCK